MKSKILIIDDDDFLLDMYALKFREAGFEVDISSSGDQAYEKIQSKDYNPDVILLDIVMPGMDGFEFLQKIKNEKLIPKTSIITLSNLGQKEHIEKGRKLGVKDYIIKAHFTPSEVVEKVKSILANRV